MDISMPVLLIISGVLIAIVLVLFWPPQRWQRKTIPLTDRPPTFTGSRHDERYWYGGLFYNNPDDPALFVPRRSGLGWTFNFGHPRSKPVLICVLLFLLLFGVIIPVLVSSAGLTPTGCHTFGCSPKP